VIVCVCVCFWFVQIRTESRSLTLGDMLWIARRRKRGFNNRSSKRANERAGDGAEEFILDFVIERKTIADVASSIQVGAESVQRER